MYCSEGFILDGYPRNLVQAKSLKDITKIDKVVEISLSDEEAVRRLSSRLSCKCGMIFNSITRVSKEEGICDECGGELFQRDDDKPEAIMKRLEVYRGETEPVIGYYGEESDVEVLSFDGGKSIEDIAGEIEERLGC